MLFHPAAHPALPGLGILFEEDKVAADAARARFFERAAGEAICVPEEGRLAAPNRAKQKVIVS
jgi:hypothetical protein